MTCTYCKEPFKCGDCGEIYTYCMCRVYRSQHVTCHIDTGKPIKRAGKTRRRIKDNSSR